MQSLADAACFASRRAFECHPWRSMLGHRLQYDEARGGAVGDRHMVLTTNSACEDCCGVLIMWVGWFLCVGNPLRLVLKEA